jgi:hypothetical protein
MLINTAFSQTNYDLVLNSTTGWPSQSLQSNVPFRADTCYSSAGVSGRAYLTGTKGWTITDLGLCTSPTPTPSITATLTPTPTLTPTITPTMSMTPSITPTISLTPSVTPQKYYYILEEYVCVGGGTSCLFVQSAGTAFTYGDSGTVFWILYNGAPHFASATGTVYPAAINVTSFTKYGDCTDIC